jgi:hypothetical protein
MSGYDAFMSFANFVKDELYGSDLEVAIHKPEDLEPPYLVIQTGPDRRDGWLSSYMCQGWVVVGVDPAVEDPERTIGLKVKEVLEVTQGNGNIPKYDYSTDPATQIGYFTVSDEIDMQPMPVSDPRKRKTVITWVLRSNCSP